MTYGQTTSIPIPPIASTVLARAAGPEDIARVALDLREELAPFRQRMADFDRRIQRPDASPHEVHAAIRELKAAMESLLRDVKRDYWTATPIGELASVAKDTAMHSPTLPISVGVLGAKVVATMSPADRWRRRKVAFLSVVRDHFNRATGYRTAVHRHFGITLEPGVIATAERWLAEARVYRPDRSKV